MIQKSWNIIIYGQDGTTVLATLPQSNIRGYPTFTTRINGGLGECVLDLVGSGFFFDTFDEGNAIKHMNIVDIYEIDPSHPLGRRIYRGFISRYEPYIDSGSDEGVKVTCLGLVSLLTKSYYKNGGTFTVSHSSVDPSTIAEAILTHFNTIYGGSLITSSSSVATVGTNVSYDFSDQKWFDALSTVGKLAGTGYWWNVDENGIYWLQPRTNTATHIFTIGKDIDSITVTKDGEKIVNDVQVRYSGGSYDASDATSQSTYGTGSPATGKMSKIVSDTSMGLDAATQAGTKEVQDQKSAYLSASVEINSNYDIESVKVGQAAVIANYSASASNLFPNPLVIVSTTYTGDALRIQFEQPTTDLGIELQSFVNG
jgi:hypothetical protein